MSVYGRMSDGQIRRLSGCESLKSSEMDSRINAHEKAEKEHERAKRKHEEAQREQKKHQESMRKQDDEISFSAKAKRRFLNQRVITCCTQFGDAICIYIYFES